MVIAGACLPSSEVRGGERRRVSVVLPVSKSPFQQALCEGIREEALNTGGIDLNVQRVAVNSDEQVARMDDVLAEEPDAIISCLPTVEEVDALVRKANEAGVSIFTVEVPAERGEVVSHVGSELAAMGRAAGRKMTQLIGGVGRVLVLEEEGARWKREIVDAFVASVEDAGIMVLECPDVRPELLDAEELMKRKLDEYDRLDGVFAVSNSIAAGAAEAITRADRNYIMLVGCDIPQDSRDSLPSDSPIRASVVRFPRKVGARALLAVLDHFEGRPVPERIPVDTKLIGIRNTGGVPASLRGTTPAERYIITLLIVALMIGLLIARRWRRRRQQQTRL